MVAKKKESKRPYPEKDKKIKEMPKAKKDMKKKK